MGEHSADFGDFETTADSCSAPKSPKNYESPTAILRILEEEKGAVCENADTLESTFEKSPKVDSRNDYSASAESMDCHAIATAWACNDRSNAAFQKVDSSNEAQNHKTRKE